MRVEVDRHTDFLFFESFDEKLGRVGLAEARHVLDGEDVGSPFLEILGEVDVIFEVVFRASGIEDVAGVADDGFTDGSGSLDGIHGHLDVRPN